jgi:methionyl aminopeptidase
MGVELKSRNEIARMRKAGALVGNTLELVAAAVRPGVSTGDLNEIAAKSIRDGSGKAAFLGYRHPSGGKPFSGVLCISVNEEIVHGIPRMDRYLSEGDIVSLDCGALVDGFYGDSARTVAVGVVLSSAQRLLAATKRSLAAGIEMCRAGHRLRDLSGAVEAVILAEGFSAVRDFVGHGIGRRLHEDPQVPNYATTGGASGYLFREGLVLAIEPMVNAGGCETETLSDGWTVVTKDRSYSAHFEHTVAVTSEGPQIMTLPG